MDFQINPGPEVQNLYLRLKKKVESISSYERGSFSYKISLRKELVSSEDYDVICVCETWLDNTEFSSELLNGYSVIPKDMEAVFAPEKGEKFT